MGEWQKKWDNIPENILNIAFILILTCLVLIMGLDTKEVNDIIPALENLSVNWLTAYDVTGISADNMLYPIQYIGMLIWGMVPFRIFRLCLGSVAGLPEVLLAAWYKVLEIYLLYEMLVYIRRIIEFYQHKKLSNTWRFVYAVLVMLYCVIWRETWNIILILLMVMGLYYYLQEQMSLFVICYLLGVLCHPAVLLFYMPLIFRKNKGIKSICDYLICLLLPLGMEFMMFISSAGFRSLLGEVVKQQGWQDALVWGVCLILSVFAFLNGEKKDAKIIIYIYIIIAVTLWLTNGMGEGYLVLLTIMMVLACINNKNLSDKTESTDVQM